MLGNDAPEASVPGEILPGREWYDYEAKYTDGIAKLLIPAPVSPELDRGVPPPGGRAPSARSTPPASRASTSSSTHDDRIWVNEINTIPGFTRFSAYPRLWEASGLPYPALVDRLIELALERHARKRRLATPAPPGPEPGARRLARPAGARRHARAGAPLTVVLAGGGTGGHTAAGLALATALRARLGDGVRLAWIGSQAGIEATWVPAAGIPYHAIPTGKLRRQLAWRNVTDLTLRVPAGFGRALALLGRLRPDVVVATGGFVAVPTAVAAAVAAPPAPGPRAGRRPGPRQPAHRPARGPGRGDVRRVGRRLPAGQGRGHRQPDPPRAPRGPAGARASSASASTPPLPLTYVTGGALGAHRVNRVVGAALAPLLALTQLVHQCGRQRAGRPRVAPERGARGSRRRSRARYRVQALVGEELGDLYAAASLVVGRAGAGTVTELAALGLPAILVPLPGARGDEQTANARVLADAGAAVLLPERGAHPGAPRRRGPRAPGRARHGSGRWPRARASLATPDAAERLVDLVLALARRA